MVRSHDFHNGEKAAQFRNPIQSRLNPSAPPSIYDDSPSRAHPGEKIPSSIYDDSPPRAHKVEKKPCGKESHSAPVIPSPHRAIAAAAASAAMGGKKSLRKPRHEAPPKRTLRPPTEDPHDLIERYIKPQAIMFETALLEIQSGQKRSCWFWFVLPTAPYVVNGYEQGSSMNRRYALRTDEQAKAFLQSDTIMGVNLRKNYVRILEEIVHQVENEGASLDSLLGPIDSVKAISSFRLFERIGRILDDEDVFTVCEKVLSLVDGKKAPTRKKKTRMFRHKQKKTHSF